ncbi:MAG TPA: hypothetical protein VGQ58_11115 [Candidatus Limnocylindrales bacterium]|nr:hypothetical protein [Candidatus Limnocylindrales bacterium]
MNPRPPPGAGLPLESREDSARWCRQQFVLSGWEVMAGPEGRPLDPARPQLHRSPLPPPGVPVACGGVGMPPLRLRIDLDRLDPVWLDVAGGSRSLAFFGPEFLVEVGEEPRITTPGGLVLIDGDVIDPDRGRPGLAVCPGGSVVAFSVPVDQDG